MIPELQTFLLAMVPAAELRLAIPVAITIHQLKWPVAYLFSAAGNLIPVIFLLLFLPFISNYLSKRFSIFKNFFSYLSQKTKEKHNNKIEKYGYCALILFVAIPLPLTGAWTGSFIAFLFNIPFKKAFPLIGLGVLAAGLIVLLLTKAGIAIEKYFGWQVLIGILLIAGIGYWFYNKNNKY